MNAMHKARNQSITKPVNNEITNEKTK